MHPNARRRSGLDIFENHKIRSVIFLFYRHRKLISLVHIHIRSQLMWVPSFCVLTWAQIRSVFFFFSYFRLQTEPRAARRSKTFIGNEILDFRTYRHINASACWRWICVRCVANCENERRANSLNTLRIQSSKIRTCWWWASVCFISTIRMLCSMAYFFALATRSCWSDVNFGKAPPNMPNSGDREPGPNSTSPNCRRSFNGIVMKGIFGCQSELWRKKRRKSKNNKRLDMEQID